MNVVADTSLMKVLPEVIFPAVSGDAATSPSPVIEFLADEEAASTRPLLTPSPPAEFEDPLSMVIVPPGMAYERQISPSSTDVDLASLPALSVPPGLGYVSLTQSSLPVGNSSDGHNTEDSQQVFNPTSSVQSVMESSSSSSSVLQEPTACAQLLSSHHYQHLTKASDADPFGCQENGGKPPIIGLQFAVRKSPDDFCFMDWNWPLIRKLSFWGTVSLLVACACVVVAMLASLPSRCDPPRGWWQGSLFYEVFPASFQDSSRDGIGDFRGLASRAQYLESLGVGVVRLNSIFTADHYPEEYDKIHNLTDIEASLGNLKQFNYAVGELHKQNISVLLDLPLHPFVQWLGEERQSNVVIAGHRESWTGENGTDTSVEEISVNFVQAESQDIVGNAISFWLNNGVDGFYLKGLEYYTDEPNFASQLRKWRHVADSFSRLDNEKILMCSVDVLHALDPDADAYKRNAVLNTMDLIDVHLDLFVNATQGIKAQIDQVTNGVLYSKPGYPWVHWHVGSIDTHRLASHISAANSSMAALLLEMMLPGTPSIFYGDEIGLEDYADHERERQDLRHVHHLGPMRWSSERGSGFTTPEVLPWLPSSESWSSVSEGQQRAVRLLAKLRSSAPSIYMNGVWKEGENLPNCEVRTMGKDIIMLERWYPRRHNFLLVANLGHQTHVKDLSSIYYGGEIMIDLRGRTGQYITFQALTLYPGESIIIRLDK